MRAPTRDLLATVLVMSALVPPGGAAGSDTVRELSLSVEMASSCPSLLGCEHSVHLRWPDGTNQLGGGPIQDGTMHDTDREGRPAAWLAVPPGPVTVEVTTSEVIGRVIGQDIIDQHTRPLASCSLRIEVPEGLGSIPLLTRVKYGQPHPGRPPVTPPGPDAWHCGIEHVAAERGAGGRSPTAPVALHPAWVCVIGASWDPDGCVRAIDAARTERRAFAIAGLAIAVEPDCPADASCVASRVVSFLTREGEAWPWSEPVLVVDGGVPTIRPWPVETEPPPDLVAWQDALATHGDRLGSELDLPTDDPAAGDGPHVCLTAILEGVLVRRSDGRIGIGDGSRLWTVSWPPGWAAREAPEGLVILDPDGETVAREGQSVRIGGGEGPDGAWHTCDEVFVPDAG